MKHYFYSLFFILGFIIQSYSQPTKTAIDSKQYDDLKKQGTLPKGFYTFNKTESTNQIAPSNNAIQGMEKRGGTNNGPFLSPMPSPIPPMPMPTGNFCSCMATIDNTFSVAPICQGGCLPPDYRNDDGSSDTIPLPFNFCLYGTSYNKVYINNNGNLTFEQAYSQFSAIGFPSSSYVMVAPFWADVDTRNTASGLVYYKITPTSMIVQWKGVGYYSMEVDKVNTFQVIITDGADPILPPGDNVAFCYGDMQWTTGAASSGINGFGGTAATVGINKGDGTTYIQLGRFDQTGAAYDGGYGNNDGIDFLDGKSFYFNACSTTNLPPFVSGFTNCDTLKLCSTGDTLVLSGIFLAPELGQTTTININTNGTPNTTVLYNTPGNSAFAAVMIYATAANAGNNVITFTATDNGVPVGTSVVNVNVFVDTSGISLLNPIVSGNSSFCVGDSVQLHVTPTTYDSYLWNTGANTPSTYVHSTGQYFVTSTLNGCSKTNIINVSANPLPTPIIIGPIITACGTGTTTLTVDSLIYASYHWSNGSNSSSISVGGGTYSVTVTDVNGCTATSPSVTVTSQPAPTILAHNDTSFCSGSANLWVTFTGSGIPSSCGPTTSGPCSSTTPYTVGTGTTNFTYPTPFPGLWDNGRIQILYTAADLTALGFTGGKINSLAFDVAQKFSSAPYNGFTLKMGCTNLASLPTAIFQTGLNTVFGPTAYSTILGWNTFNFTTAFEWDGASNIIVEACYSNTSWTNSDALNKTATAFSSVIQEYQDPGSGCNFTGPITGYTDRPNIRFAACSTFQNPANFNYQWTSIPAGGNIANPTSQFTTGSPTVITDYAVTVTNINGGCSAHDTIHVALINISTMHITPTGPYCIYDLLDTLQVSVPIGTGAFSGPGIINTNLGTFDPGVAGAGSHTIHYAVTSGMCGLGDTTIVINVIDISDPTIAPVPPQCSSYNPVTLTAATPGGTWSGPGITDPVAGIFNPALPGMVGNNIITYTINTPCLSSDTVIISVTQQQFAGINPAGGPYGICNPPINLTSIGSGGTWVGPGVTPTINGAIFDPGAAGAGTHTVSHYITAFCGDTASVNIIVQPAPVVTMVTPHTTGCAPITVNFAGTSSETGGNCYWSFGNGDTSNLCSPTYAYTLVNSDNYYDITFAYTDTLGCADTITNSSWIEVYSQPHAIFSVSPQPTDISNPTIYFSDHSTGVIDNWLWDFGDKTGSIIQSPVYTYTSPGTYNILLTVSNNHQCIDTASGTVIIDPLMTVYIPNAFSPDGNGINDLFMIQGDFIQSDDFQMLIFDRWGEKIFGTENLHEGWNGSKNNSGTIAQEGVFVYKIHLRDFHGLEHVYIGHVSLLK